MAKGQERSHDTTCRTCKGCRIKKVRCDGARPRCRACRVRNQDCEYPIDARRGATRGRKEDIRHLRLQLEQLRHSIALTEGQEHANDTVNHNAAESVHSHNLIGVDNGPVPLPRAPNELNVNRNLSPLIPAVSAPVSHPQVSPTPPIPSPESTADDNEPQVYGATNLIHFQSSEGLLMSPPNNTRRSVSSCDKVVQQELVSAAALGRQAELTIFSMPTVAQNIDFDGMPKDLAMHLLGLHWNRQHLSYLLTYRPAIMDSIMQNGPYVNKLLLNAIFYSSSLYSDHCFSYLKHSSPQESARGFYRRFKALLPDYIEKPTMPTIVALLLCGSVLVPQGKQSAGWTFCGMAYRMLIDLGYHIDPYAGATKHNSPTLSATEVEIRKRVFWGAYVCDKFQSVFLGRSPALGTTMATISAEYLDTYEELEEWKPHIDHLTDADSKVPAYIGRPSYALSTFRHLVPLCTIASRIIDELYSPRANDFSESRLLQIKLEVRSMLDDWKCRLPAHLRFDPSIDSTPPPHQITPHTTYWTLVILLEQPFLKHDEPALSSEFLSKGSETCIEAATQIWRLVEAYRNAFTLRRAQYSISYASYCAAFVMLQQCPRSRHGYMQCVRFFWDALIEFQMGCSVGLRKPLKLLKSLMTCIENATHEKYATRTGVPMQNLDAPGDGWIGDSDPPSMYLGDPGTWDDLGLDAISDEFHFTNDTLFDMFM